MRYRGFSFIELIVVLAIAGIALGIAVPMLQESIISSRVRAVAESIQSGLLLARSEAISRNAPMRFQLVSSLQAGCTASNSSANWLVTQYTQATIPTNTRGQPWFTAISDAFCNAAPYVPPDQEQPCPDAPAYSGSNGSCAKDPFIAYRSSAENIINVTVTASPPQTATSPAGFVVTFGPLGQLVNNLEGVNSTTTPVAYTVAVAPASGFNGKRYTVQVMINGGVRLCSPDALGTDPMQCK